MTGRPLNEAAVYAEAELEQVAQGFDAWRHPRPSRAAPIPQPLWQQAITCTTRLPLRLTRCQTLPTPPIMLVSSSNLSTPLPV